MANKFARAVGGNWTTDATWSTTSGGAANTVKPTASDDVFLDANSGNVTVDATAVARSLDCNGYTGTLDGSAGLSLGDATAGSGNRALRLASGMTMSYSGTISFISTSATQQTVTSAGKTFPGSLTFNAASNGSWTHSDNPTVTGTVTVTKGTWVCSGRTGSVGKFASNVTNTRAIDISNSTITCVDTGSAWGINSNTGLTFTSTGSTVVMPAVAASFLAVQTYNNLTITGGTGAGTQTLQGAFTIGGTFLVTGGVKSISFVHSTTYTFTGAITIIGTPENRITITSSLSGTAATLTKASGTVNAVCVRLRDSTAAGGATWNADENSTDISGNSGWIFAKRQASMMLTGMGV